LIKRHDPPVNVVGGYGWTMLGRHEVGVPSCIEECFYSSLEGSYFKREMTKVRDEKRIGLPLPYDPSPSGEHLLGHRHG